ncbi:hypothetical protein HPB49_000589 [Dermacentor silvarum]|uniref:Uncharacterized protein n=1 Tax=Dermacentor silvarum TaxID=543639 RepID=A0ACB8BZP7_DERSI|nr:hypothetical protein HPB49_000589 [Dermacentor silvarum]
MQTFYAGLQLNNDFRNLSKDSGSESMLVRFRFRAVAYFLACAVVTGVAIMTVLLVVLPRPRRDAQRPRALLCVREECFLGGSVMSRALDLNRDPCDDFYAYALRELEAHRSWQPFRARRRPAQNAVQVCHYRLTIEKGGKNNRAALLLDQQYGKDFIGHTAKLYRSCIEAIRGNQDHTMKLRAFLQERGLFWPRPAPFNATTDPLLVLVDLSLNWRLDLWFHVALVSAPGSNSVHVRLQPGIVNQDWARFLWMMRHDGQMTYLSYQQEASKLFTKDGLETMTRYVMEQLASLELQVAQQLSTGNMTLQPPRGSRGGRKPCDRVAWRHADCLTPGVQPSRWLAALSRHVGPSFLLVCLTPATGHILYDVKNFHHTVSVKLVPTEPHCEHIF